MIPSDCARGGTPQSPFGELMEADLATNLMTANRQEDLHKLMTSASFLLYTTMESGKKMGWGLEEMSSVFSTWNSFAMLRTSRI